jgi:hypothetical protein
VKTAISIPDETFQRAEHQAAELLMSRSEFITRAIRRYITDLEADALTRRIDTALDIAWPRGMEVDYRQHGEAGQGNGRHGEETQDGEGGQQEKRTPHEERAW